MSQTDNKQIPAISPGLQTVLQQIVDDVVERLGCTGAMVATVEQGQALPVRAYAVKLFANRLQQLEQIAGVSLLGPNSIVYLDNRKHQENLSVRAVKGRNGIPEKFIVSDQLYDLFRPIVGKTVSDIIQRELGIQQVVAIPFMLDNEVVGNLFAASAQPFLPRDIDFLTAFGRQAAAAIQSQRDLTAMKALERVILRLQATMTDETQTVQAIVNSVVHELGYAGAIMATLEAGNSLPVRAYAVDISQNVMQQLEEKAGLSLIGAHSVVYLDDEKYRDNLSVRAVKGLNGRPETFLISSQLYDLLRPMVNRAVAGLTQRVMGIKQVIAVPFFIQDEVVGNLFVATRKPTFSDREISILTSFGQQAAVGIRNARLYAVAEERRQVAQGFGHMAFSATASVHALRNHVGALRTYMYLLDKIHLLPPEQHSEILKEVPRMLVRLTAMTNILDNLNEPWRHIPDQPIEVNDCLRRAIIECYPNLSMYEGQATIPTEMGVTVHLAMGKGLPTITTGQEMLTEAFRIMIKNATEAMLETPGQHDLWLSSSLRADGMIEVMIRDNGKGIRPDHLRKIFEMGWSTKKGQGMGFGLFWTRYYITGLGGNITVESEWQKGTTFRLAIPGNKKEDSPA